MPLTDVDCKNATCPPERKLIRLTDAKGLYLEISPGGSKRWFAKLYLGGKETRIALGSYPTVSLKDARLARDSAKAQKASGVNPIQARKAAKLKAAIDASIDTSEATAREWIDLHRSQWSEAHHTRELRNLDKDLIPYLGTRPIREIEPVELLAVVRRVEARGALVAASRVLSTARGVFLPKKQSSPCISRAFCFLSVVKIQSDSVCSPCGNPCAKKICVLSPNRTVQHHCTSQYRPIVSIAHLNSA